MSEPAAAGPDRLERLKSELRALGYLGGRSERFVLADLVARPGLLVSAVGAAGRAALLGGTLVALVLTGLLAAGHESLRASPLDAVRLAGWSAALAVPACLALDLLAVLAGLARPGRPAAVGRLAGLALTATWFGYLAAWVLARFTGGARLASLAIAGALAAFLGRLAAVAALAVALDLKGAGRAATGEARRELRRAGLLAAVAAAAVALLVAVAGRGDRDQPEDEPPVLLRRDTGVRVFLLGLDGAWPELAPSHRLPAVWSRLARAGAVRALEPGPVRVPPVVWTTVATGRDPLAHGVRSLLVERMPGLDTAFPSSRPLEALLVTLHALAPWPPPATPLRDELRREPAFWEVASAAGAEVAIVNWWATYPVSAVRGALVSDRAYALLRAGKPLARAVAPAELGNALAAGFAASPGAAGRLGSYGEALLGDRFHAELALGLAARRPAVAALYLQGADVIGSGRGAGAEAKGAAFAEWADLVAGLLERVAADIGPGFALIVVRDPGRSGATAPGTLLLAGGPVRGEGRIEPEAGAMARLEDVAPTLLALAGIPASAEQSGRVLSETFSSDFLAAHPPRRVARFGRRSAGPEPAFDPADAAAEERLRSLGYVN